MSLRRQYGIFMIICTFQFCSYSEKYRFAVHPLTVTKLKLKFEFAVFCLPSNTIDSFLEFFLCHEVCFEFSCCSLPKNFSIPHTELCTEHYGSPEGGSIWPGKIVIKAVVASLAKLRMKTNFPGPSY